MKGITVARKPLIGTVAANTLKHGCGGLNIDNVRIGTTDTLSIGSNNREASSINFGMKDDLEAQGQHPEGRWPANVVLTETSSGALDEQSGISSTGLRQPTGEPIYSTEGSSVEWNSNDVRDTTVRGYEDTGGASRYFKEVDNMENNDAIPSELLSYLTDLIDPSHITGDGGVLYMKDVNAYDLSEVEDQSIHGLIAEGTPTEDQTKEMDRVLKPGGHILLVAPDDMPTGHVGACRLEDGGFEIRDSILFVTDAEGFWYVPKASRSEREAGCAKLRKDGKRLGNDHPTVKPYAIMEALLNTVPKGNGPVVDPFMGSGSTGIAALHTGHDFIGIEKEEDYIRIADARVRYWDSSEWRGRMAKIDSEAPTETKEEEAVGLSDLFGMGS